MEVVELHSSPRTARTRHAKLPASFRSRVLTLQSFNTDADQVSAGARLDPHTHSNAPYLLRDKSTAGNRCYRFVLQTSNVACALMKRARRADRVLQAGTDA